MTNAHSDSTEPATPAAKDFRGGRTRRQPPASDSELLVELPPELAQLDPETARLLIGLLADLHRKQTR